MSGKRGEGRGAEKKTRPARQLPSPPRALLPVPRPLSAYRHHGKDEHQAAWVLLAVNLAQKADDIVVSHRLDKDGEGQSDA